MSTALSVKVEKREGASGAGLKLASGARSEEAGRLWGQLFNICGDLPAPEYAFGLHEGDGGYAACWIFSGGRPAPDGLSPADMPGGWYAVSVHEGGFEAIGDTIRRMTDEWLPHGGFLRVEGPVVERYLNDPRGTPEGALRTEICLPVAPDPIE